MAEDFAKKGWHFAQKQQSSGGTGAKGHSGARQYSTSAHSVKGGPWWGRKNDIIAPATARGNSSSAGGDSLMALMTGDVGLFPSRLKELRKELLGFMEEHVLPQEAAVLAHQLSEDKWTPLPIIEELKVLVFLLLLLLLLLLLRSEERRVRKHCRSKRTTNK